MKRTEHLKEERRPVDRVTMSYSELVRSAQQGRLAAFDALVARFQKMAIGYAFFLLGNSLDSEDAAQEAFIEAYRTLAQLRIPNAFPRYLRLLVKKHCDRITRHRPVIVSLDGLAEQPAGGCLEEDVLRREVQERVRRLVRGLPPAERKVVTLYYLGNQSCREISLFLGVPVSTVKNRLLTARRRLRERIEPLMEIEQQTATAPADTRFRERIFGRLFEEFRKQLRENRHTVDLSLLIRARQNLVETLSLSGPIDWETAWHGHHIFWKMGDLEGAIALLERYLENSLPPSEEAWARRRRLDLMACLSDSDYDHMRRLSRESGESEPDMDRRIVAEHPIFVRWVQEQAVHSRISQAWYGFDSMSDACLPVWAMEGIRIAEAYVRAGASSVYEGLAEETLFACPKTADTRDARFDVLSALVSSRRKLRRKQDALAAVEQIRALGSEDTDCFRNPFWLLVAEMWTIEIENKTDRDISRVRAAGVRAIELSEQWEANANNHLTERQITIKTDDLTEQRHSIAVLLMDTGQYDLATTLLDATLAVPFQFSPWTYLWKAASLWASTRDRERVLPLLKAGYDLTRPWRVGQPGSGVETLLATFLRQKEFADVRDDPEFLAAVAPSDYGAG